MADTNDTEFDFSGSGLSNAEKRMGKKLFNDYLSTYPHLNKLSSIQLVEELVFAECIQERYKNKVLQISKKSNSSNSIETSDAIPENLQRQINNNLEQIIKLKERLGLFEEQKNLDVWEHFKDLIAKFRVWQKQNQESRKVTCPFCSEIFFLQIRTDKYKEVKSPMFRGKVLCNPKLHELYKSGEPLTKEKYAEIIGTAPDYIDWLDETFFEGKKESKDSSEENPTEEVPANDSESE